MFKASDGRTNAPLNFGVNPDFLYCEGYLKGARILANYARNRGHDQEVLIFPIAFLYRHHIELSLKGLVRDARDLSSEKKPVRGDR